MTKIKATFLIAFLSLANTTFAQNFLTQKGIEVSTHIRNDGFYNLRMGLYPIKNFGVALVYSNKIDNCHITTGASSYGTTR